MIVQPDRGEPVLLCGNRCLFGCAPGSVILEANSKLQTFHQRLGWRVAYDSYFKLRAWKPSRRYVVQTRAIAGVQSARASAPSTSRSCVVQSQADQGARVKSLDSYREQQADPHKCAPALIMSSLIPGTQVSVRPLTIPADAKTCPAWQIAAIGFPCLSNSRTRSRTFSLNRSFSGLFPPGTTSKSKSAASASSIDRAGSIVYPFFPFTGVLFSPTTTVFTPSSCRRYIGWKSSKSSKSSAAMMAALFPFSASTILSPALKLHYSARKSLSPAPRGVSLQPYLTPRDCDHVSIRRFSLPLTFFKPIPGDQEKSLILRPDCQSELTFSGPR